MNWQDAAAISAILSSVIIAITALFALRQLVEMKRSTTVTAYMKIVDILQAEDVRQARKAVLTTLKAKKHTEWTESEIAHAEKVCHTFDTVGRLVMFALTRKDLVIDSAGDSIQKTWVVLEPFVRAYQGQRGRNYWDEYEWLAMEAKKWKKMKDAPEPTITVVADSS